jgi:hypothetical protein
MSTRVLVAFAKLDFAQQSEILELCSNLPSLVSPEEAVLGIWQANNFCLNTDGTANGLFALGARLNHACVGGSNCYWQWDEDKCIIQFWTDKNVEVCIYNECIVCFP